MTAALFPSAPVATPPARRAAPASTWPRHMIRLHQYGRLAVGQLVRWERLAAAPTTSGSSAWFCRGAEELVTLRTEHVITDMRHTDTGVAVVLRHASGAVQVAWGVDAWGCQRGSFGSLHVLVDAPEQRRLVR